MMARPMTIVFMLLVCTVSVFSFKCSPKVRRTSISMTAEQPANPQKWPGNRPPVTNPEFLSQRMDAAWGRGKYRKEVWDDKVNPLNDWWTAYAPTQEEMAAAREGFDFSAPKGWLEAKGINYENAIDEYNSAQEEAAKLLLLEDDDLQQSDLKQVQAQYYKLLNKAYLISLRKEDDLKQQSKGQISLDQEDTGLQYKNDP